MTDGRQAQGQALGLTRPARWLRSDADADLCERFLAIATHDTPLAREAITRQPRRASLALARELAVPVRMYIPFGQAWLPYAFGQAMRNPRMFTWMVRDTLSVLAGR